MWKVKPRTRHSILAFILVNSGGADLVLNKLDLTIPDRFDFSKTGLLSFHWKHWLPT